MVTLLAMRCGALLRAEYARLLRARRLERLLGGAAARNLAFELARQRELVAFDGAFVADVHRAVRSAVDRQLERDVVAFDRAVLDRNRADEFVLQRARELAGRVDDELEHHRER